MANGNSDTFRPLPFTAFVRYHLRYPQPILNNDSKCCVGFFKVIGSRSPARFSMCHQYVLKPCDELCALFSVFHGHICVEREPLLPTLYLGWWPPSRSSLGWGQHSAHNTLPSTVSFQQCAFSISRHLQNFYIDFRTQRVFMTQDRD